MNPAVGCHYILPSKLQNVTADDQYRFRPPDEQTHMYVNDLPRVDAWQWNDQDWTSNV